MATFLGLLVLVVWAVAVLSLAAGITYAVIKLFPTRDEKAAASNAGSGDS
jgi:hypothetical protein